MLSDEVREYRLRRQLRIQFGWDLRKLGPQISADNLGGYMIVDGFTDTVVAGAKFDLDLDDVEQLIMETHAREPEA